MIMFIPILILAALFGLLLHGVHRKVIARIQQRPGPPVWQEILHTLKFAFKQTWVPKTASGVMFVAIALIAVGVWTGALYVLCTGGSLLLIFAFYMLHKIVEHGTGLSSGSPYTKFGAIRSVMSAAAELPLLASVAVIYLFTGTLNISEIVAWQSQNTNLIGLALPAAIALYIIIVSKSHYGPFSVIEAKELVSGYWTEHFGGWRTLLNVADALKTVVLLGLFAVLFFGAAPLWALVIVMIAVMITVSFVCALCPMLSPYNSVAIQFVWTAVVCVYGAILWGLIL